MKTIIDYIDLAKEKNNILSDRQLSVKLGLSPSNVRKWKTGNQLPSDTIIVRLAEMAGISPEQAVFELSYWKADIETKPIYERLLKKVITTAACTAFILGSMQSPALASPEKKCNNDYVMLYIM